MRSVVLFSGGMDSTVCLVLAKQLGDVFPLFVSYGQKHALHEHYAATKIAWKYGCALTSLQTDLRTSNTSSLLQGQQSVPLQDSRMGTYIPTTYIPGRNILLLSLAVGLASKQMCDSIWIGSNKQDAVGYPDCRREFFVGMQEVLEICVPGVTVQTPLLDSSKTDIVDAGKRLSIDFSETWSCYQPDNMMECGLCDACILKRNALEC